MTEVKPVQPPRKHSFLSGVDDFFLKMEDRNQLMTISGMWLFDAPLSRSEARSEVEKLVARFPRLAQRVHEEADGRTRWEDDPEFDISNHLVFSSLPAPSSMEQLREFVAQQMGSPFSPQRPLWQMDVVEGLEGGKSAVLTRIHHCIADGQGSVRMVLSLTTDENGQKSEQYGVDAKKYAKAEAEQTSSGSPFVAIGLKLAKLLLTVLFTVWTFLAMHVSYLFVYLRKKRFLNGPGSSVKDVAWSSNIDLNDVKFIKDTLRCTVNDVLLATLTYATRSYMLAQPNANEIFTDELLCAVPVSVRSIDDWQLGNKATMVWQYLPAKISSPMGQLREIQSRMNAMKRSPAVAISWAMTSCFGKIPGAVRCAKGMLQKFLTQADCALTNVPGPVSTLYFAKQPVVSYLPFIPQVGPGGLGMAIMTYNGKVAFSVLGDLGTLLPNPTALTAEFEKSFQTFLDLAKQQKQSQGDASESKKSQ